MSRPQKIIPQIKGGFTDIITAIADGKGVVKAKRPKSEDVLKASQPKPKK
jgi:hypothetical protein